MTFRRTLTAGLAATLTLACGGSGGSTPTSPPAPPTPTTAEFMGRTTASGASSCGGDLHVFDAQAGTIGVQLLSTTGSVGLSVQLCAGNAAGPDCTISRRPIGLGETVTAERRGASSQTLSMLTANCGGNGPAPTGPVDYTVRVTYLR